MSYGILFYSLFWIFFGPMNNDQDHRNAMISMGSFNSKYSLSIFLCGDVMLGRGVDQILKYPGDPKIFESYMKSAEGYVDIAERKNGPIPSPVECSYVWGDALTELEKRHTDLRIINLETSITKSNDHWQGKGINYRMNPQNIDCLLAPKIDLAVLANNHVLDWGGTGLVETIQTLESSGINFVGAGRTHEEAIKPVIMYSMTGIRVIVFSLGTTSSGIPRSWHAQGKKPGVNLLKDFSPPVIEELTNEIRKVSTDKDVVIVSIHWGGNWGYDIPDDHLYLAHKLIDEAGVDVIHGHSSHHFKAMEVYKERLIMYGCGDFINDYEGISGYENFRDDLGLMYFVMLDGTTGTLLKVHLVPTQLKKFRINHVTDQDRDWVINTLNREGKRFGTSVVRGDDHTLELVW